MGSKTYSKSINDLSPAEVTTSFFFEIGNRESNSLVGILFPQI